MVFAGYSGFLHYLQLASHELATIGINVTKNKIPNPNPILCFGCKIWVIKRKDEDLLSAFQRYAARRIQRFHARSVNITSYVCLGWMSIIKYIKALKLIFLRSIIVMREHVPIRRISKIRKNRFSNFEDGNDDPYDSPIIHALQVCIEFGLLGTIKEMINATSLE